jgi:hypothetical protein
MDANTAISQPVVIQLSQRSIAMKSAYWIALVLVVVGAVN